MERYDGLFKLKCEKLYVEESKSARQIALTYNGKPNHGTIARWIKLGDWEKKRKEYQIKKVTSLSDQNIVEQILDQVNDLLNGDMTDEKKADALAKYLSSLEKISPRKRRIPTLFKFLEEFGTYIKDHHPALMTPELVDAMRGFKDKLLKQLSDPV